MKDNRITSFPAELLELNSLTMIEADWEKLAPVPTSIISLTNLVEFLILIKLSNWYLNMHLPYSSLKNLPGEIDKLVSLTLLNHC